MFMTSAAAARERHLWVPIGGRMATRHTLGAGRWPIRRRLVDGRWAIVGGSATHRHSGWFDTLSFAPETGFGWASGAGGRISRVMP